MSLLRLRRLATFRRLIPMLFDFVSDFGRFAKHSSATGPWRDEEKLRASITAFYHNIEKGLSLRSPRPGFGIPMVKRLLSAMNEFIDRFGARGHLVVPYGVLHAYAARQKSLGVDVDWLLGELESIKIRINALPQELPGGVVTRRRTEVLSSVESGGSDFFFSRSSCRQFSGDFVGPDAIERAVQIAQKAPVVCNRQSGKIYSFRAREDIDAILEIQGGARGFSDEVPLLLCVAVDLRNFNSSAERYQGWIDGGLFAMSLIYGLHAEGLATCCLNWSRVPRQDADMRRLLGLPESENIVMFIAAGHYPEEFRVAASVRKPISEVYIDRFLSHRA